MNRLLGVAVLCTVFFTQAIFAQSPANGQGWKKRVFRTIYVGDTTDYSKRKLKPDASKPPLSEIITDQVSKGLLEAYNNSTPLFESMITKGQWREMVSPQKDTVTIEDPITGKQLTKVISRDIDFRNVVKFRICEDWVFDRNLGKTTIQIAGIAPVMDVYGDDGQFHGSKALYWVRYNDAVKNILEQYQQEHPKNNLAQNLWEDYFDDHTISTEK